MTNEKVHSFKDLALLKSQILNSKEDPADQIHTCLTSNLVSSYKKLTADQRSKWEAILKFLEDPYFFQISQGTIKEISSKKYSIVLAVLTYPTIVDDFIKQEDLDLAHTLAHRIKRGVNQGRIKYTDARVPNAWPVSGNPGTKR